MHKLMYGDYDHMGGEELEDNIFRIAQTNAKLKRDKLIKEIDNISKK